MIALNLLNEFIGNVITTVNDDCIEFTTATSHGITEFQAESWTNSEFYSGSKTYIHRGTDFFALITSPYEPSKDKTIYDTFEEKHKNLLRFEDVDKLIFWDDNFAIISGSIFHCQKYSSKDEIDFELSMLNVDTTAIDLIHILHTSNANKSNKWYWDIRWDRLVGIFNGEI